MATSKKTETAEQEEKTSFTAFDFVNEINKTKKNLIRQSDTPDHVEKQYKPFLTNRSLSYFEDTVFFANEMNACPHLFPAAQFEYLLNTVRPRSRYSKWGKPETNKDIEMVSEFYQCNQRRAREYLSILSKEQVKTIRDTMARGKEQKAKT